MGIEFALNFEPKFMSFANLRVYKIAFQLESELYGLVCQIPNYRFENTCQQILRSSSSVSANIAEGCGKRYFVKEFIRFLNIALGSCDETQHHINTLFLKKLLEKEKYNDLAKQYKNLSVRILNLINHLTKAN